MVSRCLQGCQLNTRVLWQPPQNNPVQLITAAAGPGITARGPIINLFCIYYSANAPFPCCSTGTCPRVIALSLASYILAFLWLYLNQARTIAPLGSRKMPEWVQREVHVVGCCDAILGERVCKCISLDHALAFKQGEDNHRAEGTDKQGKKNDPEVKQCSGSRRTARGKNVHLKPSYIPMKLFLKKLILKWLSHLQEASR